MNILQQTSACIAHCYGLDLEIHINIMNNYRDMLNMMLVGRIAAQVCERRP